MNNYSTKQTSHTIGSITIAGIFATQFFAAHGFIQQQESIENVSHNRDYQTLSTPSTFDNYKNPLTGEYTKFGGNQFEMVVSDFYLKLLTNHKPLGEEFEKILYENIWDLYES